MAKKIDAENDKKAEKIRQRIAADKDKIADYLSEHANISLACKRAGVSRDTFYRWRKDDEDFDIFVKAGIMTGKSRINDMAHHQLVRKIQDGDIKAVTFQLEHCHGDYGGKDSTDIASQPIVQINLIPYQPLDRSREYGPDRAKILGEDAPPDGIVGNLFP